jgi:hypothetical protein
MFTYDIVKSHMEATLASLPASSSWEVDVNQTEFRSLFVIALDPVIEHTIELLPMLDRTNDCNRLHQLEDSLLDRSLKAIARMIERPPVLDRTHVCAQAHMGLILIFCVLVINYDFISLF